jgi:hypothetical protein
MAATAVVVTEEATADTEEATADTEEATVVVTLVATAAMVAVTSGMAVGGCQAKVVAGAARFGSAAEARRFG